MPLCLNKVENPVLKKLVNDCLKSEKNGRYEKTYPVDQSLCVVLWSSALIYGQLFCVQNLFAYCGGDEKS